MEKKYKKSSNTKEHMQKMRDARKNKNKAMKFFDWDEDNYKSETSNSSWESIKPKKIKNKNNERNLTYKDDTKNLEMKQLWKLVEKMYNLHERTNNRVEKLYQYKKNKNNNPKPIIIENKNDEKKYSLLESMKHKLLSQ